jgi:hypothetical protein
MKSRYVLRPEQANNIEICEEKQGGGKKENKANRTL